MPLYSVLFIYFIIKDFDLFNLILIIFLLRDCPAMCKGRQTILFAWAKNAPPTVLPKGNEF